MTNQIGAVFFVLLLVAALGLALRCRALGLPLHSLRAAPSKARNLTSITRLQLTRDHCLHVVVFGDARLLVATHPKGISIEPVGTVLPSDAYAKSWVESKP